MANRMISVPDELNQRMKQHKDVNWSSIATAAFEHYLNEGEESLETIMERMKRDAETVQERITTNATGAA